MKKVLIFTGAGFSFPLKLPLTDGFTDILVTGDNNFDGILNRYLSKNSHDIEHVLSTCEDIVRKNTITDHFLRASGNGNYQHVLNDLESFKTKATRLISLIQNSIFERLAPIKSATAFTLYYRLFEELRSINSDIAFSMFTTNYDLSFEEAVRHNKNLLAGFKIAKCDYGFDDSGYGSFIYNPDNKYKWGVDSIEYKKIHGSIDWLQHKDGSCFRSGAPIDPKNPGVMPLLFPGFKGEPDKEPFISLHNQLLDRLRTADVVIVIGFAFRDPYINNIFKIGLLINSNLRVVCFNPKELKDLPLESGISNFVKNYPNNFFYVKKGIVADKNPLEMANIRSNLYHVDGDANELDKYTALIKKAFGGAE